MTDIDLALLIAIVIGGIGLGIWAWHMVRVWLAQNDPKPAPSESAMREWERERIPRYSTQKPGTNNPPVPWPYPLKPAARYASHAPVPPSPPVRSTSDDGLSLVAVAAGAAAPAPASRLQAPSQVAAHA